MQFNHIQLPAFAIATLYKHCLVLVDGEKIGNGQLTMQPEQTSANVEAPIHTIEVKTPIIPTIEKEIEPESRKTEAKSVQTIFTNESTKTENNDIKISQTSTLEPPPNKPTANIKYLGGFGKKVSIVLADHFHPHINDGDLAFLTKLLQACQLSLNDVAIINVASNPNLNQLWQLMPAEKMIIFEVDPGTIGLPFRLSHFKLQPWSDCVFLTAPSLQALQEGTTEKVVQLKRNLWESLKKMFLA